MEDNVLHEDPFSFCENKDDDFWWALLFALLIVIGYSPEFGRNTEE